MRDSALAMKPKWLAGEAAVIGLARSGRAVSLLLARNGVAVYASDASSSPALRDAARMLRPEGIDVQLEGHDLDRIERAALVVVSPGVPPAALPIAAARRGGAEVVSEVEVGLRFLPELLYIAVTGTNGKTTTTALIAHLLRALGRRAEAAGNIGVPLSELALNPNPPTWAALEVSSFQLHDTSSIAPSVGVLTNLSPNHLDRYASVDDYYGDKALLFRNASAASTWVTNGDDAESQRLTVPFAGLHCRFSLGAVQDAQAYFDRAAQLLVVLGVPMARRDQVALLGDHNVANALAATLAVVVADPAHRTPPALRRIADGLRSFKGLPHRIESLGELGGVVWINDSKSTNVASTLMALRAMIRPTILLLGGRHKGEPYTALTAEVKRTVKAVIAYGESSELIQADLGRVAHVVPAASFSQVVDLARAAASPGDAVLLSPACSSFDMFANYEARGAEFTRLAVGGAAEARRT